MSKKHASPLVPPIDKSDEYAISGVQTHGLMELTIATCVLLELRQDEVNVFPRLNHKETSHVSGR